MNKRPFSIRLAGAVLTAILFGVIQAVQGDTFTGTEFAVIVVGIFVFETVVGRARTDE